MIDNVNPFDEEQDHIDEVVASQIALDVKNEQEKEEYYESIALDQKTVEDLIGYQDNSTLPEPNLICLSGDALLKLQNLSAIYLVGKACVELLSDPELCSSHPFELAYTSISGVKYSIEHDGLSMTLLDENDEGLTFKGITSLLNHTHDDLSDMLGLPELLNDREKVDTIIKDILIFYKRKGTINLI